MLRSKLSFSVLSIEKNGQKLYNVKTRTDEDIAAEDGKHWVTLKNGEHVLIDENGEVVSGAGGALTGEKLSKAKSSNATENVNVKTTSGASKGKIAEVRSKFPRFVHYEAHHDSVEKKSYEKLKYTKAERKQLEDGMFRIFKNSDYGIYLPSSDIAKILQDGYFKNQYQTGTTSSALGGESALRLRDEAIGLLLGLPEEETHKFGEQEYKDFEKYGCLVSKNINESFDEVCIATSYGDALVRLKKENLAGKVTYTVGDSIDDFWRLGALRSHTSICALGDAEKPSIAGMPTFRTRMKDKHKFIKAANKAVDGPEFINMVSASSGYIELQLHGDITVDDIESVTFDYPELHHNGWKMETESQIRANQKMIAKELRKKGIKVYFQGGD